jgi:hypothetical protein
MGRLLHRLHRLHRREPLRAVVYFASLAAVVVAALALVVPFGSLPLRVPFCYQGDGLIFTVIVKAVEEDGPFHFEHIGAPFGSAVVDWPLGMWLPLAVTSLLTWLLGHAGTAVNVYWLLSIVGSSLTASWAMRRLALKPSVAFVFGILFAFLPFAFYRNVGHVNAAYPLVPLVGLLALRVAGQRVADLGPGERRALLVACAAQGLSYVYYSFFGVVLLLVAIPLGWLRTHRRDLVRLGALGVLLLGLGAAIPLVPSFVYWSRHGRNQSLEYKSVADADRLGLKLRQLITPNPDHPFEAFRAVARRVEAARFPDENENVGTRLGLVGTIGLAILLGFALARSIGALREDEDLGPPAALTFFLLLLAQVGGFGSMFNVVVAPDIRAYNRAAVFVGFFALLAAGVAGSRLAARGAGSGSFRRGAFLLGLLALGVFGVADQVPRGYLAAIRATGDGFDEDESFVARVESRLPPGAMVFQIPHATIPLDRSSQPPVEIYDAGRAYLSSRRLCWSWGSILGRTDEWQTAVAALPAEEMVDRLVRAGFAGLWVDRWGFTGRGDAAGWQVLEARLCAATGSRPEASTRGRYSFLDLTPRATRLRRELDAAALAAEKRRALRPFVVLRWREGCPDRQAADGERACAASAAAIVRNFAMREVRVRIGGTFHAEAPGRLVLAASGGGADFDVPIELGEGPVAFERESTILADRKLRLAFSFAGPCPSGSARCWQVSGFRVSRLDDQLSD